MCVNTVNIKAKKLYAFRVIVGEGGCAEHPSKILLYEQGRKLLETVAQA